MNGLYGLRSKELRQCSVMLDISFHFPSPKEMHLRVLQCYMWRHETFLNTKEDIILGQEGLEVTDKICRPDHQAEVQCHSINTHSFHQFLSFLQFYVRNEALLLHLNE